MESPKISVVIGSYNRVKLLKTCIQAVRRELDGQEYEIIVVDDGSFDGSIEWLTAQKDIISVIQYNRVQCSGKPSIRKPWAYSMNVAFKVASGKYICMLSDNARITSGAILNGVRRFETLLEEGILLGGAAFYTRETSSLEGYMVSEVDGTPHVFQGILLRPAVVEVGYANEDYRTDLGRTDLMYRLQAAGYQLVDAPGSRVDLVADEQDVVPYATMENDWRRLYRIWSQSRSIQDNMSAGCSRRTEPEAVLGDEPLVNLESDVEPLKVSVVTVVFQDPSGLEKTIKSVLAQTYAHLEFIIVDGGSKDETQNILHRYRDRIDVIISEPDNGIYDAMNKGIFLATGEYIVFMNADDSFANDDVVSLAVPHLRSRDDVVYGHRNYIRPSGAAILQKSREVEYVKYRMPYCHQAAFVRSYTLRRWPFNQTYRYAADYNQVVEIYMDGGNFRQIDLTVCNYAAGGMSESGIRPYLEVLKIQFDNFGDGENMKSSDYMRGFIANNKDILAKYSEEERRDNE